MLRQPCVVAAIIVTVGLLVSAAAICIYLHAIDEHLAELKSAFGNPVTVRVEGSGGGDVRVGPIH
jgi:hypothetical protein